MKYLRAQLSFARLGLVAVDDFQLVIARLDALLRADRRLTALVVLCGRSHRDAKPRLFASALQNGHAAYPLQVVAAKLDALGGAAGNQVQTRRAGAINIGDGECRLGVSAGQQIGECE